MDSYTEGCHPKKALFGGIAFSTEVTLGSFLPSMLCVVKLPNSSDGSTPFKQSDFSSVLGDYVIVPPTYS